MVLLSVGLASADQVTLTWNGPLAGDYTGTLYSNQGAATGASGVLGGNWSENVYLPPYSATISNATGSFSSLNGEQSVYCVDLVSGVGSDGNYNLVQMGSTAVDLTLGKVGGGTVNYTLSGNRLNAVEYLLANYYTKTPGDQSSALSLALWHTIYSPDSGHSLPATTLSTDISAQGFDVGTNVTNHDAVIADANGMLGAAYAAAQGSFTAPSNVYLLQDASYQDFTFAVLGTQSVDTPEPMGAISIAGMCLIGLPFGYRAFRNRHTLVAG
jgi:hypothetical protein